MSVNKVPVPNRLTIKVWPGVPFRFGIEQQFHGFGQSSLEPQAQGQCALAQRREGGGEKSPREEGGAECMGVVTCISRAFN